jgi:hypothetical protein
MWQKLHDRVTALEDWVKRAQYPWSSNINGATPETINQQTLGPQELPAAAEAPAQDPSAEGVG